MDVKSFLPERILGSEKNYFRSWKTSLIKEKPWLLETFLNQENFVIVENFLDQ